MEKKKQIEQLYADALYNDEAPNVFADRILSLFSVSKRYLIKKANGDIDCPKCTIICAIDKHPDYESGDVITCSGCNDDYEIP